MDTPSRRVLLRASGTGLLAAVAGCVGGESDAGTPTETFQNDVETVEGTPLYSLPASVLPKPRGGWDLEDRRQAGMAQGRLSGWHGSYLSPDDVRFEALVLGGAARPSEAVQHVESLDSAGWPVTLAHERLVYAAGSGTAAETPTSRTTTTTETTTASETAEEGAARLEPGTATPEPPILMDRTPIPGTADEAGALLALAPRLSPSVVEERRSG